MSEQLHKNHSGFSGGTLVHTENGLVAIKDIKVGDLVLSTSETGKGEPVFKPVVKVLQTENVPLVNLSTSLQLQGQTLREKRNFLDKVCAENNGKIPYQYFYVTLNHLFLVEEKGWVAVNNLESGDVLLDNKQRKFTLQHPGYDGDVRAKVYKTAHPNIGFLPNYGLEYSVDGSYIDLTTGKVIQDDALQRNAENDPTLAKLYQNNPEWEQDLRDELDVPEGEPAEFFGFKTGEWVDPSSIDKNTLATTTVYNLEVENTHTYFVGEEGILVSDCHF